MDRIQDLDPEPPDEEECSHKSLRGPVAATPGGTKHKYIYVCNNCRTLVYKTRSTESDDD